VRIFLFTVTWAKTKNIMLDKIINNCRMLALDKIARYKLGIHRNFLELTINNEQNGDQTRQFIESGWLSLV